MSSFKKLLFVCMGNSCSSPLAEAIMQDLMVKTSIYWEVDSAGLRAFNIGRRPDQRCLRTLREHGLRSDHFCRQFSVEDFRYYDFVVAMDEAVYRELKHWSSANRLDNPCEVLLLSAFGKNGEPAFIHSLSMTCKQKVFRSAYYQIKDCCKQLILVQNVDIVKYELPSSDDDMYYTNQSDMAHDVPSSVGAMTSSTVETACSTTSQISQNCPPGTPDSCTQGETQRKMCHKCGQKFLAAL